MRLRDIIAAFLKMRFFSWLGMTEQHVVVWTDTGMNIRLATFVNGRRYVHDAPPAVPDHVPDNWTPPQPPFSNN